VGGLCDNGYRLPNKVTHVCGAAHFSQSSSTLNIRRYRPDFEFLAKRD
jgi:hypothetical protein